jgi:tetratricopeptide (TPR) repeat protein
VVGAVASSLGGCGGSSHLPHSATSTAPFTTLLHAGNKLLSEAKISAAEQLYQQAIAKSPADPVGHYDLGVAYQTAGDRGDALLEYRRALTRNPSYVPALYNEAVLVTPTDAPLAIFYFRQVIRIQPRSPTALLNLGLLEHRNRPPQPFGLLPLDQSLALDSSLRLRIPASLRDELRHTSLAQLERTIRANERHGPVPGRR